MNALWESGPSALDAEIVLKEACRVRVLCQRHMRHRGTGTSALSAVKTSRGGQWMEDPRNSIHWKAFRGQRPSVGEVRLIAFIPRRKRFLLCTASGHERMGPSDEILTNLCLQPTLPYCWNIAFQGKLQLSWIIEHPISGTSSHVVLMKEHGWLRLDAALLRPLMTLGHGRQTCWSAFIKEYKHWYDSRQNPGPNDWVT